MTNLSATIDAFGALKAQQADLLEQEKAFKATFAALPAGSFEGDLFRLSISDSVRETPDKVLKAEIDAVVEAFRATLTRQFITAHTNATDVRTHKVSARNGQKLAA